MLKDIQQSEIDKIQRTIKEAWDNHGGMFGAEALLRTWHSKDEYYLRSEIQQLCDSSPVFVLSMGEETTEEEGTVWTILFAAAPIYVNGQLWSSAHLMQALKHNLRADGHVEVIDVEPCVIDWRKR